jgi:hypothetical protein
VKLYQLERGSSFTLDGDLEVFRLVRIDGMYSIVADEDGCIHYFTVFAEVEPVEEENNG